MTCHYCRNLAKKHGRTRNGLQRFYCQYCKKTFCEPHARPLDDMRIELKKALSPLHLLVEGVSIRSTERLTSLHRDTILDLLVLAGECCQKLMDERIHSVPVREVQADEIWGFIFKKEKHKKITEQHNTLIGDAYAFVSIESHSKLVLNFELGRRDSSTALRFVNGLRRATRGRFQFTTDGLRAYIEAVELVFGADIDFSQLSIRRLKYQSSS
jgi:transposase-like protein